MTSISGKNEIDWDAFAARLAPVEVIAEPVLVKKRSRDFFWYSPILNEELKRCFGDLVAVPKTADEMKHCLKVAYKAGVPVVLRGGGTGNYGQAVPVDGGLIIETTRMNRVLEIGDGFIRAEAGALMADMNAALKHSGQEMAMFPSTQDIATVGGFVAGGSAGIGSLASGALREPGNLIALRVLSLEAEPQEHLFEGEDVLKIHHAWGLNGVITEVTLRTVQTHDWIACMATFDGYQEAYAAGYALATAGSMAPKLASVVDARIVEYFPRLKGHVREGCSLLVAYVPADDVPEFCALIAKQDGHVDQTLNDADREAKKIPHAFEFCYNHTTLQVLKSDRSATYQQIGVPDPADAMAIALLRDDLGDDVWTHHEFLKLGGEVTAIDLPIIWYSGKERLDAINQTYSDHGFAVYDAHSNQVERGGLHNADYSHLAWKKRLDPKGLLNSAKSTAWEMVKDLTPEEIQAKTTSGTPL
ncbi:FAD-binding oxidoreductase [Sulfitobacter mediterraneus]|uniref:FAD/FMN-containing dehydrogenase n=1 Tax=Sulfitobacter mediterraneus TaxID=83219 RepID=A0A2T6CAA5_9RHOB|nr:FAD-binding oxidoreductase [Sulfitobacter mediterraneus]KIN78248.1 FAD linked oxidase-like protein [Sulfitobacter mediterraneus KCTC 32188]PTX72132.1 FAD/FMN-containing dehydrogenase [Sulfitobacter mediterraneus]